MHDSQSVESDPADVTGRGWSDLTVLGEILVCIKHFDMSTMTLLLGLVDGLLNVRELVRATRIYLHVYITTDKDLIFLSFE